MRNLLLLLFLCVGLWVENAAVALQIKTVVDNETTTAKISSVDVTRIFVEGDRIRSVKGVKGTYTRENDEKNGEIYIQPLPANQDRAFTMLIDTEQGRHFTLLLTPTASPSETLMLMPKGVGRKQAARFEQASNYDLTLAHLLRAMKSGDLPEGYVMHTAHGKTTYSLGHRLAVTCKEVYDGLALRGEVFQIKNTQAYPLTVEERGFYQAGVRAISLDTLQIPPFSTIHLYRVMRHA